MFFPTLKKWNWASTNSRSSLPTLGFFCTGFSSSLWLVLAVLVFFFLIFSLWRFVLLCVYILLFILFLFSFLVFFFFFIFFEKVTEWLESPSELPVHSKEYNLNPFITWNKTRNKKFPILSWKKMLWKILRKNAAFICGICPVIFEWKLLKENWKNCYTYLTCDQAFFFFLAPERGEGKKKEAWHIYLTSLLPPLFCLPVIN